MQDLLSQLSTSIIIGLIIAGVLALVVVVLLARRLRRRQPPPDEVAPSLGGPIDYTSLPVDEEPSGWRERFANLSLAGKILVVLVPLLAILGILVLVLTLLPPGGNTADLPPPVPITLTVRDAAVVRGTPPTIEITVQTTGLEDGTEVVAELQEDGQPLGWMNPEQARDQVRSGRAEFQVGQAPGSPNPQQGKSYKVVVRTADGQSAGEVDLLVPAIYAAQFFGTTAAVVPTATLAPTATVAPTSAPEATPEPSATAQATALPSGPEATVSNGGNVRSLPFLGADNRIGGVNASDAIQLIARTPNGEWYQVRFTDAEDSLEKVGWISASLLSISADAEVPIANVVTVFGNGALYEQPDSASTELDRVNLNEVVELRQKSAAGDWYQLINVRGIEGWVSAELLGIPPEVAAQVPVAP